MLGQIINSHGVIFINNLLKKIERFDFELLALASLAGLVLKYKSYSLGAVIILIMGLLFSKKIWENRTSYFKLPTIFAAIWFGWMFAGFFWAYSPNDTKYYLKQILISMGLISLMQIVRKVELDRFKFILNWIWIINLIICLLEIFTPFRMIHSQFSIMGNSIDGGLHDAAYYEIAEIVPTGLFYNRNTLAVFVTIYFPLIYLINNSKLRFLALIFTPFLLVCTGSIGNLFIFIMTCVGIILMTSKGAKKVFAALPLVFYYLFLTSPLIANHWSPEIQQFSHTSKNFKDLLESKAKNEIPSTNAQKDEKLETVAEVYNSSTVRRRMLSIAENVAHETKGMGLGVGGFSKYVENLHLDLRDKHGEVLPVMRSHNLISELLSDQGYFGLIIFLTFYTAMIFFIVPGYKIWEMDSSIENQFRFGLFLGLTLFLGSNLSLSQPLFFMPWWFLIGLALKLSRRQLI